MKTIVQRYRHAARQKAALFFLFFAICLVSNTIAQRTPVPAPNAVAYNNKIAAAPLLFTENKGQVTDRKGIPRPDILFTAYSAGAKLYFTAAGIHYQFEKRVLPKGYKPDERKVKDIEKQEALRKQIKTQTSCFTISLKDANPSPHIRKEAQNEYTENFYLVNCAVTGVHTYERLVYENVYPGIDWVVYAKGHHLEYDFLVHPGADPALIKLHVKDAKKVSIATDGGLVITTDLGEVKEAAPVSYCSNATIATAFRQEADETIGFAVGVYDNHKELTIDPAITWATYYGSSGNDIGRSCTVDTSGNVYLSGSTTSLSGIASGGFQNTYGGGEFDAFLAKFSSSGTRIWATYYGGGDNDIGRSCAVDTSGNVYLSGSTTSTSGIASNGFQNTFGGNYDAFLVKFNSSGARIWATYYGNIGYDNSSSCNIDALGNVYLSGYTGSTSGIASGGFQNISGGDYDAYLAKFSSSGARIWATYYGGDGSEGGGSCTVDALGNVYLSGYTTSISGIAFGGFQNTYGGGDADAFLAKFSSSGTRIWATYFGGDDWDVEGACTVDASGSVYLTGSTSSESGIASGGFQNIFSGYFDAYLVKFSSSGTRLWATYYGGISYEESNSCTVDASGNVYLAGSTGSASGIASGGFQNTYGSNYDAYLAKFSGSGTRLWATYFGGSGNDGGGSCVVDASGNVYLAGSTTSVSGIASGGFQNVFSGGDGDAYLVKINDSNVAGFISIADGNWNNPAIWSGGVVPSAGSVVIINTLVTVTANASCYSLKINPSSSVTVRPGINLIVLH